MEVSHGIGHCSEELQREAFTWNLKCLKNCFKYQRIVEENLCMSHCVFMLIQVLQTRSLILEGLSIFKVDRLFVRRLSCFSSISTLRKCPKSCCCLLVS